MPEAERTESAKLAPEIKHSQDAELQKPQQEKEKKKKGLKKKTGKGKEIKNPSSCTVS